MENKLAPPAAPSMEVAIPAPVPSSEKYLDGVYSSVVSKMLMEREDRGMTLEPITTMIPSAKAAYEGMSTLTAHLKFPHTGFG